MKYLRKIVQFEIRELFEGLAAGIFTMLIAALGYLATLNGVKTFSNSSIGPVTIPRIICAVIFFLGIIQVCRWFLRDRKLLKKEEMPVQQELTDEEVIILAYRKFTPILSFLIIALYIYLMRTCGFVIASTIYLTLQIPLLSTDLSLKSFVKAFAIGAIASTVIFLIFGKGFQLRLPKGKWGF